MPVEAGDDLGAGDGSLGDVDTLLAEGLGVLARLADLDLGERVEEMDHQVDRLLSGKNQSSGSYLRSEKTVEKD